MFPLAEKANDGFHSSQRQLMEMSIKGTLPMEAVEAEPEPSNPYSPAKQPPTKHNEPTFQSQMSHSSQSLYYSPSSVASPGARRSFDSKDMLGLRQSYVPRKLCVIEKELHTTRYLPPQPYFVTNSKTEVTVWGTVCTRMLMIMIITQHGQLQLWMYHEAFRIQTTYW